MKKTIVVLVISISLILMACAGKSEPKDMIKLPMRITAQLEGSDAVFTADVFEDGCDITFDSGHSLAGTELHFGKDGNTATCGGFTRSVKSGTFPAQEALIKALRGLSATELSGVPIENGVKYTIDEMTIMVYYDKDTELINGIGTEENGRHFKFKILSFSQYEG